MTTQYKPPTPEPTIMLYPKRTIAKLRKGGEKEMKNGKLTYGKNLTYLRMTIPTDAALPVKHRFHAIYGNEPRLIRARLFYPTIKENWWKPYTLNQKGRLTRVCDGATCWHHVNQRFVTQHNPIACARRPGEDACPMGCKQAAELYISIEGMELAQPIAVCVTSKNEISWIEEMLEEIERRTLGLVDTCPIVIERKQMEITKKFKDDNGNIGTKRAPEWMVTFRIDENWDDPYAPVRGAVRLAEKLNSLHLPSGLAGKVFGLPGAGAASAPALPPPDEPDMTLVAAVSMADQLIEPTPEKKKPPVALSAEHIEDEDEFIEGEEGGDEPGKAPDLDAADRTEVSALFDLLMNMAEAADKDAQAAKIIGKCQKQADLRGLKVKLGKGAYANARALINACVDFDSKPTQSPTQ